MEIEGVHHRGAWHVLEPKTPFKSNWHIEAICEHLEAVTAGELRRLIINIPPRYMKSISVSIMWPTWEWTLRPEIRWLFASYAQTLSTKHSIDRRTVLQSRWYQTRFGQAFSLATDQNVKTEFANDRRGHMIATSIGGSSTGKGGDRVVVDDPVNPEEAWSILERERANRVFDQTLSTRLDDEETGAFVIVMQRLHEEDLTGHLLARDSGWTVLCLPAEYEPSHPFAWPDDQRGEQGELLWPERQDEERIAAKKLDLGSYAYAGQFQQRPAPAEGGILKRAWWSYWDPDVAPDFSYILQSWDTAVKDKTANDFTVGQVWGALGPDRFLIREMRGRWDLPETISQANALHDWCEERYGTLPHRAVVEKAANGPEVIAVLQRRVPGVRGIIARGDKMQRAAAVTPQIESGNVFLPGRMRQDNLGPDESLTPGWVLEFIEECAAFPNGAHDDRVDTMSQALQELRGIATALPRTNGHREPARTVTAGLLRRDL